MRSRKNYLKYRKKLFKWKQIGMHSDSICSECGQNTIYQIYRYDAWCCISCNKWLEDACDDPACPYCSARPQTPMEAYALIDLEVGSAGEKKMWRRRNYQHKTDGKMRHQKKRATFSVLN